MRMKVNSKERTDEYSDAHMLEVKENEEKFYKEKRTVRKK